MKNKKIITILSLSALVIAAAFGAVAYHSAQASALTSNQTLLPLSQPLNTVEYHKGLGGGITNEDLANAPARTSTALATRFSTTTFTPSFRTAT